MATKTADIDYSASPIPILGRRGNSKPMQYKFKPRIKHLAEPKQSKLLWCTSVGPRVQWGTQETLWPLSGAALTAQPSARLCELAAPKRNFQEEGEVSWPEFMFSCGRSSVVWEVPAGARHAEPSDRVLSLAAPKQPPEEYREDRPHWVYSCGRSSPIWEVNEAAVKAKPNHARIEDLAKPKKLHPNVIQDKCVQTVIPAPALTAGVRERLETLSVPKPTIEGPFRAAEWPVTDGAKNYQVSSRSIDLAKPKGIAEGYVPSRDTPVWSVSRGAKAAKVTSRVDELAMPIIRASMDHVQFDPNAFLVKQPALKAKCTPRLEELASPIMR